MALTGEIDYGKLIGLIEVLLKEDFAKVVEEHVRRHLSQDVRKLVQTELRRLLEENYKVTVTLEEF